MSAPSVPALLLSTAVVGVALATDARAEGPWVPDWSGDVRYHAEALVSTPQGFNYLGVANLDGRAITHEVAADLSCTGTAARKGWEVTCTLDEIQLGGEGYPGDQDDLDAIMAEYAGMMKGKTVQVEVAADGRITTIDLEGIDKRDDRMAQIHEAQRQLLRRIFAPLDVGFPKKGEAKGDEWKQKGQPLLFELMTSYGTAGGSTMKHSLGEGEGDLLGFTSFGRGNVGTGLDFEVGAGQLINLIGGGQGLFDPATGKIAWREVSVTGEYTAQSIQVGDSSAYALAAWAGRIDADGNVRTGR